MTKRRGVDKSEPAGSGLSTGEGVADPHPGADLPASCSAPPAGQALQRIAAALGAGGLSNDATTGPPALADVLMAFHLSRQPLPAFVLRALVRVLWDYRAGRIDAAELLRRLGVDTPTRTRAQRRRDDRAAVVHAVVERWRRQGFRKVNPAANDDTAFHRAAEELRMPVSTLYDVYRGRR